MADRYDEDRWTSRGPAGWDDNRIDNGDRTGSGRPYNRDRNERGPMARGADEVRSWFGDEEAQRRREMDEQRHAMRDRDDRDRGRYQDDVRSWSRGEPRSGNIGREWSPYDAQYGWESGGRTGWRDTSLQGHGRGYTERGDRDAYDRFQSGYFDSSMGYAGASYGTGNLNPFQYRGPSASNRSTPGGTFSGRGPRNYQRSDERIREDIVDRLTDDHRVDASDIDVQVRNGEVTLSGDVHDRRMRRAAEECIEDLPGVRDVHNNLRVGSSRGELGSPGAQQDRDDVTSLNISGPQSKDK